MNPADAGPQAIHGPRRLRCGIDAMRERGSDGVDPWIYTSRNRDPALASDLPEPCPNSSGRQPQPRPKRLHCLGQPRVTSVGVDLVRLSQLIRWSEQPQNHGNCRSRSSSESTMRIVSITCSGPALLSEPVSDFGSLIGATPPR